MKMRFTDEVTDIAAVASTIISHDGEIQRFARIPTFLNRAIVDGSYKFFVVRDDGKHIRSCGVVTFLALPMADDHVLALELLWIAEDDSAVEALVWQGLIEFAQRLDFRGVVVSNHSVNNRSALVRLLHAGAVGTCPVALDRFVLQKLNDPEAVPTAFAEAEISAAAFYSMPVIAIGTGSYHIDVAGVEYESADLLYRGEGRLTRPGHWACRHLRDLTRTLRQDGVVARGREVPEGSNEPFEGTMAEQLLHQGFVGQGAVSLSTSMAIAARYATRAGSRNAGLVARVVIC